MGLKKVGISLAQRTASFVKATGKTSVLQMPKSVNVCQANNLHFASKPVVDTVMIGNKSSIVQQKFVETPRIQSKLCYEDDRIFGFDGNILGLNYRNEIRDRILSRAGLNDQSFVLQIIDDLSGQKTQLAKNSKYYNLGVAKLNKKTQQHVYICENLKDMPDFNGLRGKTPLSARGKGLDFRLKKIKESGINTIIDLRAKSECSSIARDSLNKLKLNYVNFPVGDLNWTSASLDDITRYIQAVQKGDFYVGCANGQARTDLAVAINYVLNPLSENLPKFYYGSASSSRVSVKDNLTSILKLVDEKPDIIKTWGWKSYDDFKCNVSKRLDNIIQSLSHK